MHYVYDLETYPNVFTFSCRHAETGDRWYFEISERRNDLGELTAFLFALRDSGARMVGFNNVRFDYPIAHMLMTEWPVLQYSTWFEITQRIMIKVREIFASQDGFGVRVWQPIIPQVDLFLIHHFNNKAKATSLKVLEFNMQSVVVVDLPFEPGTQIPVEQIPTLAAYNMHDVDETTRFFWHTKAMIDFRDELSAKYDRDFINHNDTKIGKDYFIMQLEAHQPGTCYYQDGLTGKRQPRQTSRIDGVRLADVIFPYVQFERLEFKRILQWMASQVLTSIDIENSETKAVDTKGVFKDVHCIVDGFRYDFGTGGIHGSLTGCTVVADDQFAIIDLDVASYYPNLAIANRLYPEHLGEAFCDIYRDVYEQRKGYKKGTAENAMLKLALNGVYGDSNNHFSPFFDPRYTMSITINGQLLLCMLAEFLLKIPALSLIQINTDGLTVRCPRQHVDYISQWARYWESITGLVLEDVSYKAMHIRDVNNYIAVYEDGKIKTKTKGAYESKQPQDRNPLGWHQNMSALVVPKAAEAALVHGTAVEEFIRSPERDLMDFMCRTKIPRNARLMLVYDDNEVQQQNVTRYLVANEGGSLVKISPPPKQYTVGWFKKKTGVSDDVYFAWHQQNGNIYNPEVHTKSQSIYQNRRDSIEKGWKVQIANDLRLVNWTNVNFDYYIAEARKLVDCIK